jgi:hypothetical protein
MRVLPVAADEVWQLSPSPHLYPLYRADPLRATFSAQAVYLRDTTIANIGRHRFDLKLGGELNVLGLAASATQPDWLQLILEAGFHGQFDADQSQDNTGWDGIYALYLSLRQNPQLAYRFGMKHISSHIGDELIERSGRQRIDYTRQEWRFGAAWSFADQWLSYVDAGYGFGLRDQILQAPWRAQLGVQYEAPSLFWNKQFSWYTAMDMSSYQENDWHRNYTLQLGLVAAAQERHWRIGLEFYDGRAQLGEFFQDKESYLGVGLWIDL